MSPQDFVSRFLHAHTDIQLSDEATKLLAGVVDQKKDGLVFWRFSFDTRWSDVSHKLRRLYTLRLGGFTYGITAIGCGITCRALCDRWRGNTAADFLQNDENRGSTTESLTRIDIITVSVSLAEVADLIVKLLCWVSL